jgi:hypothetical protein
MPDDGMMRHRVSEHSCTLCGKKKADTPDKKNLNRMATRPLLYLGALEC